MGGPSELAEARLAAPSAPMRLALAFAGSVLLLGLAFLFAPPLRVLLDQPMRDRFTRGLREQDRWMGPDSALLLHGADGFRGVLSLRLRAHPGVPGGRVRARLVRGEQILTELELGLESTRIDVPLTAAAPDRTWLQPAPIQVTCDVTVPGEGGRERCAELGRVRFEPEGALRFDVLAWRALSQAWLLLCVALLFRLPAVCAFLGGRDLSAPVLLVLAAGVAAWARADPYTLAWVLPPAPNVLLTFTVLLAAVHFRRPRALEGLGAPFPSVTSAWRTIVLPLAAIAVVGLLLRTYRLTELPFGMWRDEARHGLLAARLGPNPLEWPIYEPRINSPGFGLWLLGLGVEIFGIHAWSMRPVTALAGALTAIPLFLFARRLTGRVDVAMLAAAFVTFSSWHVLVSRFQFPTVFGPPLLLSALWLVLEADAADKPRRLLGCLALAGACAGLAVQTYHTGRLAPVVAVLVGALVLWRRPHPGRAVAAFGLGLLLTLAPLGLWVTSHSRAFNSRESQLFVVQAAAANGIAPLSALDASWGRHLVMFNLRGDESLRLNLPGRPMLDVVTGLCFLAGLVWILLRGETRLLLVVGSLFLAGLAPSALAVEGPHALRAIEALPPAAILAALGWTAIVPRVVPWPAAPLGALAMNAFFCFVTLPNDPRSWQGFYPVDTQMGTYVRRMAREDPARAVYVPEQLLEARRSVLLYLTYGLRTATYADASASPPPRSGDIFLCSPYSLDADLGRLQDFLGVSPRLAVTGPTLPGTKTPSFLAYEAAPPIPSP